MRSLIANNWGDRRSGQWGGLVVDLEPTGNQRESVAPTLGKSRRKRDGESLQVSDESTPRYQLYSVHSEHITHVPESTP